MRLNIDPGIPHFRELLPSDRLPSSKMPAPHTFGVDKHGEWIPEFFHDRPGNLVLRFPAIIECDDGAARRNVFLTAFPGQKILHGDDGDAAIFQLLHLLFEGLRCDFRVRPVDLIDETVVSKNADLSSLIDRHFLWL